MAHLHGPRMMHGTRTPAEYAAKQQACVAEIAARLGVTRAVHPATEATDGFVSEGRWVIQCPACYAGAAVDVDAGVSRCFECGAVYTVGHGTLRLPSKATVDGIDDILGARRDVRTRNWVPGEQLPALRRDNADHGIEEGAR